MAVLSINIIPGPVQTAGTQNKASTEPQPLPAVLSTGTPFSEPPQPAMRAITRLQHIGNHLHPSPARLSRAVTLQSTRGVMASVFQEVPQVRNHAGSPAPVVGGGGGCGGTANALGDPPSLSAPLAPLIGCCLRTGRCKEMCRAGLRAGSPPLGPGGSWPPPGAAASQP